VIFGYFSFRARYLQRGMNGRARYKCFIISLVSSLCE